jgi:transcriptional regulator with XRE-family HTH domain
MPKRLVNTKQSPRKPQSIDAHVGNQLKARRMMAVMSQIGLGKVAGITFQQVQKYERGANRIAAGHLYLFAQAAAGFHGTPRSAPHITLHANRQSEVRGAVEVNWMFCASRRTGPQRLLMGDELTWPTRRADVRP